MGCKIVSNLCFKIPLKCSAFLWFTSGLKGFRNEINIKIKGLLLLLFPLAWNHLLVINIIHLSYTIKSHFDVALGSAL